MYLGYIFKEGQQWLSKASKETVLKIPPPTSAKPLYEATKGDFIWIEESQKAFDTLKWKLLEALALGLPDEINPSTCSWMSIRE